MNIYKDISICKTVDELEQIVYRLIQQGKLTRSLTGYILGRAAEIGQERD